MDLRDSLNWFRKELGKANALLDDLEEWANKPITASTTTYGQAQQDVKDDILSRRVKP